jgi:hypothetical protein
VRELLFVALVLACPLMMIWMMRGHTHGGDSGQVVGRRAHNDISSGTKSAAELRRQRDELDRLIQEREFEEEGETPKGVSVMGTAEDLTDGFLHTSSR